MCMNTFSFDSCEFHAHSEGVSERWHQNLLLEILLEMVIVWYHKNNC